MFLPAVRPIGNLAYESVRPAHNESSAFMPFPRAVPKLMMFIINNYDDDEDNDGNDDEGRMMVNDKRMVMMNIR